MRLLLFLGLLAGLYVSIPAQTTQLNQTTQPQATCENSRHFLGHVYGIAPDSIIVEPVGDGSDDLYLYSGDTLVTTLTPRSEGYDQAVFVYENCQS